MHASKLCKTCKRIATERLWQWNCTETTTERLWKKSSRKSSAIKSMERLRPERKVCSYSKITNIFEIANSSLKWNYNFYTWMWLYICLPGYMRKKRLERERLVAKARKIKRGKGVLKECPCCFDNELLTEDLLSCPGGHPFCRSCIRQSTEVAVGEGRGRFPCLSDGVRNINLPSKL